MPLPTVRTPQIRDPDDLNQRDTRNAIRALDQPGVRKVSIPNTVLGATTVLVRHQLGKVPVGWQVSDKNAQADIWRDPTAAMTADTIPLKASATVTVTLLFW